MHRVAPRQICPVEISPNWLRRIESGIGPSLQILRWNLISASGTAEVTDASHETSGTIASGVQFSIFALLLNLFVSRVSCRIARTMREKL